MNKLYKAFETIAPNDLEKIQKEIETRDTSIITSIEMPKKRNYYKLSFAALVCVICLTIALVFQKDNVVFATVGIDVNPSVELNLDGQEKIVEVITHNEAGKKIVGNMELEGSHIDVAMNALIGSMLKEGYINELKNSLLISVTGDNKEENEKIRKRISQDIDDLLKGNHINGAIISQTLNKNTDLETIANQYHISVGKAEIIQQLIQRNTNYTFESLKDLTVNDLNILLTRNNINDIQVDGEVNTKSYISKEKVKQIVQEDSHISRPSYQKIELDCDDGKMVYEVEFINNSIEYEYELDAKSGKILNKEIEKKTSKSNDNTDSKQQFISQAKAKTIAMNHAKVKEVSHYKIKKDKDDGVWEYEIEFENGNKKYEYTINAHDGKILDYEVEKINSAKITSDQAKQIALKHAKISNKNVKNVDIELEDSYYEISFETSLYEYEYKINSVSGKIISYEKEKND